MDERGYTTSADIEKMREELAKCSNEKKEKSKIKKVLGVISTVLFSLVILFLLLCFIWIMIAKASGKAPNLFGYYIFEVETGSMQPLFPVGCLIVSKGVDSSQAKELTVGKSDSENAGDIVTYTMLDGRRVTHRLVEKVFDEENNFIGYRTKGDNPKNSIDEETLTFDRIIAVFCYRVPLT